MSHSSRCAPKFPQRRAPLFSTGARSAHNRWETEKVSFRKADLSRVGIAHLSRFERCVGSLRLNILFCAAASLYKSSVALKGNTTTLYHPLGMEAAISVWLPPLSDVTSRLHRDACHKLACSRKD